MDINIISFSLDVNRCRIGKVMVEYAGLHIYCELVLHVGSNKLWVRMPERWMDNSKVAFCIWHCKDQSANFQAKCLEEIALKFGVDACKAREIYSANKQQGLMKKRFNPSETFRNYSTPKVMPSYKAAENVGR